MMRAAPCASTLRRVAGPSAAAAVSVASAGAPHAQVLGAIEGTYGAVDVELSHPRCTRARPAALGIRLRYAEERALGRGGEASGLIIQRLHPARGLSIAGTRAAPNGACDTAE